VDARERFKHLLARTAHAELLSSGWDSYFFDEAVSKACAESGASEADARRALREMTDAFLLIDERGDFRATPFLALLYEEQDRSAAYQENDLRRRLLAAAVKADAENNGWASFGPDDAAALGVEAGRLRAAARILDAKGLIELDNEAVGFFTCEITSRGHELNDNPNLLDSELPTSATHDSEASMVVAQDALGQVIWTCEQMLERRGWETAMRELATGDREYEDGDWVNAVREYYAALESGLKYALTDAGVAYDDTLALRKLAGRAADGGLIPTNYQAVFGFPDSIRSPRSHGGGPTPSEVEVGQHEALLMANLTRAALLYIGGRPPVQPSPAT
jgi:hypothetical protein